MDGEIVRWVQVSIGQTGNDPAVAFADIRTQTSLAMTGFRHQSRKYTRMAGNSDVTTSMYRAGK